MEIQLPLNTVCPKELRVDLSLKYHNDFGLIVIMKFVEKNAIHIFSVDSFQGYEPFLGKMRKNMYAASIGSVSKSGRIDISWNINGEELRGVAKDLLEEISEDINFEMTKKEGFEYIVWKYAENVKQDKELSESLIGRIRGFGSLDQIELDGRGSIGMTPFKNNCLNIREKDFIGRKVDLSLRYYEGELFVLLKDKNGNISVSSLETYTKFESFRKEKKKQILASKIGLIRGDGKIVLNPRVKKEEKGRFEKILNKIKNDDTSASHGFIMKDDNNIVLNRLLAELRFDTLVRDYDVVERCG